MLLAVAAAAVALVVILGSGSSQHSQGATTNHARAGGGARPSASGSSTTPGGSGTTSGTSTPGAAASSSGQAVAAAAPVSAVESFYRLAAAHDYAAAWGLADPTFQAQLGGYESFAAGQSGDRSITFNSATVLRQTSSTATVSIATTSVRNDGSHLCNGTVDLSNTGATWLLHLIHITCT